MPSITFPEPDTLAPEVKLSDDQLKAIDEIKDEPWDTPAEPAKDKKEEVKPDPEPEQAEEEGKQAKTPEEEAAEKTAAAEQERLEKKAKETGKIIEEIKKIEAQEKAESDRIEKIAKEEGITAEEVKANEAKDKAVADRHGADPIKIARALRKEQSEYGKLKNEADALRKLKAQVEAQNAQFNEDRFNTETEKRRDDIIGKYREKFPQESENLSDDAIFERGKAIIRRGIEKKAESDATKLRQSAETKRTETIKNLPEEFKDFVPEVKELLTECGDTQIMDQEFDVSFLANYARGKKYTPDYIKSLEEAAYKRGVEQAKIVPKVPAAKPGSADRKENIASLNDTQKRRAEEIYGRREGWTKQRMHEEYAKHDLKEDSKW